MSTVYIAGPMRGIPEYNFPAFHQATSLGRSLGWNVISPAEMDLADGIAEEQRPHGGEVSIEVARGVMLKDAEVICKKADAIALLPGWQNSRGAKMEVAIALSIGLPLLDATTFEPLDARLQGHEVR